MLKGMLSCCWCGSGTHHSCIDQPCHYSCLCILLQHLPPCISATGQVILNLARIGHHSESTDCVSLRGGKAEKKTAHTCSWEICSCVKTAAMRREGAMNDARKCPGCVGTARVVLEPNDAMALPPVNNSCLCNISSKSQPVKPARHKTQDDVIVVARTLVAIKHQMQWYKHCILAPLTPSQAQQQSKISRTACLAEPCAGSPADSRQDTAPEFRKHTVCCCCVGCRRGQQRRSSQASSNLTAAHHGASWPRG